MPVVQKSSELFPQRLVALVVMTGDHRLFEQHMLDVLRQAAPSADDGLAKGQGVTIFLGAHGCVLVSAVNSLNRSPVPRAFRPPRCPNICIRSKASFGAALFWSLSK